MKKQNNTLWFFDSIVRFFAMSRNSHWAEEAYLTQQKILKKILIKNKNTFFANKYNINGSENYSEFSSRIPISSYDELFPYIQRMIEGEINVLTSYNVTKYAKSSGTSSGKSKYIPTPSVYMKKNHFKAGHDVITSYARAHSDTKIFSGKAITIIGSMDKIPNSTFVAGDVSALIMEDSPWWTAHSRVCEKSLSLNKSWSLKAKGIVEKAVNKNVVSLYGTPTWMLEILESAKKQSGVSKISELWPNLEVFFHGAVSFVPYRETYEKIFGSSKVEFREVYNASEGVFAYEDNPIKHPGEMLLCTNHAVFYEFIVVQDCIPKGKPIPLQEISIGVQYAIIITTLSGLWRYIVGDVVVFTSKNPYRLKIVGRTTHFLNAFGEEVIADNAVRAIEDAIKKTGGEVQAFTASSTFSAKPAQGAHEWAIEFKTLPKESASFARALDLALRARNSDYEAKRTGDIILGMPIIHIVPERTFRKYMESLGKLGGQNKVPLLSNDRKTLEAILNLR